MAEYLDVSARPGGQGRAVTGGYVVMQALSLVDTHMNTHVCTQIYTYIHSH